MGLQTGSLLHGKDYIGRLSADFGGIGGYQVNLLMKDFRFNITGKATTVPQKGNILQKPFHTMPSASVSFNTYIRAVEETDDFQHDILAVFMQLGREQSFASVQVLSRKFDKLLLQGNGIISSVSIAGRAGGFIVVRVALTLEDYQHSQDGLTQLMMV